ncbi:unnamed protein product [Linum trigynum]|uniref:Uncharacterized protein n=1 Tax=Linum trigynum TaxID=586398 RepID=A0AAV2FP02_9ROSI
MLASSYQHQGISDPYPAELLATGMRSRLQLLEVCLMPSLRAMQQWSSVNLAFEQWRIQLVALSFEIVCFSLGLCLIV